uniref:Small ribosomal subunit protein uS14c n=1 Tax=Astrosyne radiata TaxID=1158023 RepID=A0A2U9NT70_9STRA|nr:ribosomal protein S14 [Astrosyne radiata]AWT40288.1 ribosomal protein S14 [Astrosyne radiata]
MTRKGLIEKEKKRILLVKKYKSKRIKLLKLYKNSDVTNLKFLYHLQLQRLTRNSSKIRLRNRCLITGRPRGFFRNFRLSRHVFREMTHKGLLPGLIKSSW